VYTKTTKHFVVRWKTMESGTHKTPQNISSESGPSKTSRIEGVKEKSKEAFSKPIIVRMNVGDENIRVCVGDIQGGAMNRGLLVAGPPPPTLGGCERKD
jgi:hypothetical protein